jgi:hypothetical protein
MCLGLAITRVACNAVLLHAIRAIYTRNPRVPQCSLILELLFNFVAFAPLLRTHACAHHTTHQEHMIRVNAREDCART